MAVGQSGLAESGSMTETELRPKFVTQMRPCWSLAKPQDRVKRLLHRRLRPHVRTFEGSPPTSCETVFPPMLLTQRLPALSTMTEWGSLN